MYNKYCISLFRLTSSPEGIDNYCRKSVNIQNNIEILKIGVFSTPISPRAAGRRRHAHRLRWLPVGGPPLGEFFFTELIKTNDFNVKIIIFKCFLCVFLSKYFIKYCYFHENTFLYQFYRGNQWKINFVLVENGSKRF